MWGYAKSSQNRFVRRARAGAGRGHRAARAAADERSGAVCRRHADPGRGCRAPTPEPDNGLPKVNTGSWELTLVNAHNSIGEAVPEDLAELEGGRYFDGRAVDALKEFIAAARAEGLSVCLSSAYRSYNEQTYLFNRKVSQCGGDEAAAARIVNRPGTSEHQLGLCADITDKFYEVKTQDLEKTALYQWMYAHCQDYGRQAGHHRRHVRAVALPLRRQGGGCLHYGKRPLPRGVPRPVQMNLPGVLPAGYTPDLCVLLQNSR